MKHTVNRLSSKYVEVNEIICEWRLEQEIVGRDGITRRCKATVEFRENGQVVTIVNDEVNMSSRVTGSLG